MNPKKGVYYNENDGFAVSWLRNLIKRGLIADGEVDERSIEDVEPKEIIGFVQHHFFAGIGVWSYALGKAGWSSDRPAWTGSCPCQPFSQAGRKKGFTDKRHLWPAWFELVKELRPPVVFGEQVANVDGGRWLDLVSADLEGEGYAFGAADLPAAGVGAPHLRQRFYFVAESGRERREGERLHGARRGRVEVSGKDKGDARISSEEEERRSSGVQQLERGDGGGGPVAYDAVGGREEWQAALESTAGEDGTRPADDLFVGDAGRTRSRRNARAVPGAQTPGPQERFAAGCLVNELEPSSTIDVVRGFWEPADLIYCRDGKYRPVEPGTFPLAHGAPSRVGRLRAYGNALVAPAAEVFVRAYMGAMP